MKAAARADAQAAGEWEESASGSKTKKKGAKLKKPSIMVKLRKRLYVLRTDLRPSALHRGWIENPEEGDATEVALSDLRIESILEG